MTEVKWIGKIVQVLGMLVMFAGFILLVINIQKTLGHMTSSISASSGVLPSSNETCNADDDPLCGIDVAKDGAMAAVFGRQVYEFLGFIGVGILLIIIGLILQSSDEICGFLAGVSQKKKNEQLLVGRFRKGGKLGL